MAVRIIGTGSYAPEKILSNQDLEKMVDTSDEWITTRTGIKFRHIASKETPNSDLAFGAAKHALEAAGIRPDQLDFISVASVTHDHVFPSTSCILQRKLDAAPCACYDVQAACSGLLYSFDLAYSMLKTHKKYHYALIVGSEKLSSIVDWEDRGTCVLFGDAASALVLESSDEIPDSEDCYIGSKLGADGHYTDILQLPAGGSAMPASHETLDAKLHYIKMGGQEVFKLAVTNMVNACKETLKESGVTPEQLAWVIPHQANKRIISAVAQRLGVSDDQVYVNVDRYGNTSAASIGICLDELSRGGKLKKGDYVLLTAFGGGLTWAATLIRW